MLIKISIYKQANAIKYVAYLISTQLINKRPELIYKSKLGQKQQHQEQHNKNTP